MCSSMSSKTDEGILRGFVEKRMGLLNREKINIVECIEGLEK